MWIVIHMRMLYSNIFKTDVTQCTLLRQKVYALKFQLILTSSVVFLEIGNKGGLPSHVKLRYLRD